MFTSVLVLWFNYYCKRKETSRLKRDALLTLPFPIRYCDIVRGHGWIVHLKMHNGIKCCRSSILGIKCHSLKCVTDMRRTNSSEWRSIKIKAWVLLQTFSNCRYALHNDVSVNDGPHIRRWSHNITIYYNTYHCVTTAYSIQYSNMLYRFVALQQ